MSRHAPSVRVAGAAAVGHHMGAKGAEHQQAAARRAAGQEANAPSQQHADLAQQTQQPAEQKAATPVVAPVDDTVEQLMKLTRLHDAGALSDEEFTAAKARIVG